MRRVKVIPQGEWVYFIDTPKHADMVRIKRTKQDGSTEYLDVQRSIWESYCQRKEQ